MVINKVISPPLMLILNRSQKIKQEKIQLSEFLFVLSFANWYPMWSLIQRFMCWSWWGPLAHDNELDPVPAELGIGWLPPPQILGDSEKGHQRCQKRGV